MTGGGNGERALVGVRRKRAGRVVREHVRVRRRHRESEGEETGGGDRGESFEAVRGETERKRAEEETGVGRPPWSGVPSPSRLMSRARGSEAARDPNLETGHRAGACFPCAPNPNHWDWGRGRPYHRGDNEDRCWGEEPKQQPVPPRPTRPAPKPPKQPKVRTWTQEEFAKDFGVTGTRPSGWSGL